MTTTAGLLTPAGEMLLQDLLRPMGTSRNRLAQAMGVSDSRSTPIVKGTGCGCGPA